MRWLKLILRVKLVQTALVIHRLSLVIVAKLLRFAFWFLSLWSLVTITLRFLKTITSIRLFFKSSKGLTLNLPAFQTILNFSEESPLIRLVLFQNLMKFGPLLKINLQINALAKLKNCLRTPCMPHFGQLSLAILRATIPMPWNNPKISRAAVARCGTIGCENVLQTTCLMTKSWKVF